jgi:AcrR family transcriptional regulator
MSTSRLPGPERRRQLLDCALLVFSEQGYHGASMNGVANAAGVTKPVLYQHFQSKRELYLELLDDVGRRLNDEVTMATRAARGGREQARAGLAAYFGFVAGEQAAFSLLFGTTAAQDEEFARANRIVQNAMASTIARLLDPALDEGRRLLLAHGIVGLAEGACRHWLATETDLDPDELADQVAELLYGGLKELR